MEFGFGSVWMMSRGTVVRVDPSSDEVTEVRIEDAVWVVTEDRVGFYFRDCKTPPLTPPHEGEGSLNSPPPALKLVVRLKPAQLGSFQIVLQLRS